PGADQAVRRTRNKRIGIIGTEGTINSNAYQDEMRKIVPEIETFALPCPLFVPIVEEGWHDHQIADIITREYLNPLLTKEIDTLVLGCT
ncbi:glutamate racemase, partial [Klebsiella quasipneumoniae]|uniref:glutamate racemase n=1 Tax=Klebsiella quasipneumoniae TaxID=1463165 RepID=UPI002753E685|nr:glutamate racemase [Klebsiella quasipneumoniae]